MVGDIYRYTYRRIRVYLQIHLGNDTCLPKLGMVTTNTCLFTGPVGFGPVGTRLGDGALPPNQTQPKDGHPLVNS